MEKRKESRIPKLTMSKDDVSTAIGRLVKINYKNLVGGRILLNSIEKVLATIQPDNEFTGEGKYRVVLDIYGSVADENGIKENEHFMTQCMVDVFANEDNSPAVKIKEQLFLTKM